MMRRTAKPFTIEVKKRGGRRRDGDELSVPRATTTTPTEDYVGQNMRFRDAETLFRARPEPEANPAASQPSGPMSSVLSAVFGPSGEATSEQQASTQRRILPDLIAEAAITEQAASQVEPEPRRRGRPPKVRTDEPVVARKRGRPRKTVVDAAPKVFDVDTWEQTVPVPAPVIVTEMQYFVASERRRAARSSAHLPRGERWKRRLPRVCW